MLTDQQQIQGSYPKSAAAIGFVVSKGIADSNPAARIDRGVVGSSWEGRNGRDGGQQWRKSELDGWPIDLLSKSIIGVNRFILCALLTPTLEGSFCGRNATAK